MNRNRYEPKQGQKRLVFAVVTVGFFVLLALVFSGCSSPSQTQDAEHHETDSGQMSYYFRFKFKETKTGHLKTVVVESYKHPSKARYSVKGQEVVIKGYSSMAKLFNEPAIIANHIQFVGDNAWEVKQKLSLRV